MGARSSKVTSNVPPPLPTTIQANPRQVKNGETDPTQSTNDEIEEYSFSFSKALFALFKFFCCCFCCFGQWDKLMNFLNRILMKVKIYHLTIAILFDLYSDGFNTYIFASYRLSRLELNENTAVNIGNFIALVIISGITVVVVLVKIYTKGLNGDKGKMGSEGSEGSEGDSKIHSHYLQHIMFARVAYIYFLLMEDHRLNESSTAFHLATTCTNAIFTILKYFLQSLDQGTISVTLLYVQLAFSGLSMLDNMITITIIASKDGTDDKRGKIQKEKSPGALEANDTNNK